jgi:hypothetical protein
MMVFSVADGKEWPIGATHWQCPPVWSSADNVWTLEESPRGFVWVEKEVETALRTGRRIQVTEGQGAISDEPECWPKVVEETSPLFRRLRVETEETSSILRLQAAKLSD